MPAVGIMPAASEEHVLRRARPLVHRRHRRIQRREGRRCPLFVSSRVLRQLEAIEKREGLRVERRDERLLLLVVLLALLGECLLGEATLGWHSDGTQR